MDDGPAVLVAAGVSSPAGSGVSMWRRVVDDPPAPILRGFDFGDRTVEVPVYPAEVDPLAHVRRSELRRLDRVHVLACAAVDDLFDVAGGIDGARTALVVGMAVGVADALERQYQAARNRFIDVNPFAAPSTMASSVASLLSRRFALHGPCLTVNTACASGADAIALGSGLLASGVADHVIAGGVDAPLTDVVMAFFARMDAIARTDADGPPSRPFDARRSGFVAAEGAAFVLLERQRVAERRAASPIAALTGAASTCDAHHPVMPEPDARWSGHAVRAAMAAASVAVDEVVAVNAHGTSTPLNDRIEGRLIADLLGPHVPVTASKSATGHMLGGSGAFEAIVAGHMARTGCVPPVHGTTELDGDVGAAVVLGRALAARPGPVVSSSFGFGGHNAVLVLEPVR